MRFCHQCLLALRETADRAGEACETGTAPVPAGTGPHRGFRASSLCRAISREQFMDLSRKLDELAQLRAASALTQAEFAVARAHVLAEHSASPGDTAVAAVPAAADSRLTPQRLRHVRRRIVLTGVVATALVAGLLTWGLLDGIESDWSSTEISEVRSDTDCAQLANDLFDDGEPNAVVYPVLEHSGCESWLRGRFEEAERQDGH